MGFIEGDMLRHQPVVPLKVSEELERELVASRVEAALARVENERLCSYIDRLRVEVEQRAAERDEARQNADAMLKTIMEENSIIKTRTAERDEARREYCEVRADLRSTPISPEEIAANRGWDCFK